MKIDYINDTDFKLFVNNYFFDKIEYESKEELMALLKSIIVKLKNSYNIIISGFYEVNIYILRNIGIEFHFNKCDNYTFSNKVIDLKMTVNLDPIVYLSFDNYDYISEYSILRYKDGKFYIKPDALSTTDIIKLSDFYSIVLDEDENIENYLLIKKN